MEYLVGHHHTYKDIDGLDYQILVEADFLVNYFEDGLDKEHIKKSAEKIFKTETGKKISKKTCFSRRLFRNPKPGHRMPFRIWKILLKSRGFISDSKWSVK